MAIPTEPVGSLPRPVKLQAAIAAYDTGNTDSQKLSARDATKRQIGSCAWHEDSPTRLGWSTMPKTTVRWANLPRRDRVERRLAAILAADVVGFSRMIGIDEVGVLEGLRELRGEIFEPLIAGHGGRIFKLMGDGLLAEFPSVVLALRAAIDIQRSQKRRNADIPADVAARLESLAQPGGICISARVYEDAVGNIAFDAEDMGEQKLKNIARPVRVYHLNLSPREAGAEEKEGGPGHTTLPGALARAKHGAAAENAETDTTILPGTDAIEAPRLSVAVLPFVNVGGNTEHDHFVDSITETLTTDLSCISGLFVISRNTAGSYKGTRTCATRIRVGRQFGRQSRLGARLSRADEVLSRAGARD
jgi:adenylate cyclase